MASLLHLLVRTHPVREPAVTLPVPATIAGSTRTNLNVGGRSVEFGILGDRWTEPPEDIYTLTRPVAECPDEAAYVEWRLKTAYGKHRPPWKIVMLDLWQFGNWLRTFDKT